MTGGRQAQATGEGDNNRKRILIEASKIADSKMDGIKRYVVELLEALIQADAASTYDVDVMVKNHVLALQEIPGFLHRQSQGEEASAGNDGWLKSIGQFIPPIVLPPIKWLIPASASRRFLGKEKSELIVPDVSLRNFLILMLPPVLVQFLHKLVPARLMQFLMVRGVLAPFSSAADPEAYDLIHLTLPNHFHHIRRTAKPMLVTVHDLCHVSCPEFQTRANSVSLKMGLDGAVRSGAGFLAVSGATKTQLINEYKLDPGRASTAYNGCRSEHFHRVDDPQVRARVCRKYGIPDSPFLLALSTIEPRKNLAGTIRAFNRLSGQAGDREVNLVIAGARGWKSREIMRTASSSGRIYLTGYVDDEDLAAIYSSARAFLYISHYEGFGLPLLEAMSCGLPVIYGNNSSMPEIVADAGLAADSRDINDMCRQMHRLVSDDDLVASMRSRALERAATFTWARSAEQTMAAYRKLLY